MIGRIADRFGRLRPVHYGSFVTLPILTCRKPSLCAVMETQQEFRFAYYYSLLRLRCFFSRPNSAHGSSPGNLDPSLRPIYFNLLLIGVGSLLRRWSDV